MLFKRRFKELKGFVAGVVVTSIITTSTFSFAGMESIQAFFNDIKIRINGKSIDVGNDKPFVYNGRTYVPARYVAEGLGASVKWNETDNCVDIDSRGENIEKSNKPVNDVKNIITPTSTSQSIQSNGYKYKLTDTEIQEAIDEGLKGIDSYYDNIHPKYLLPRNNTETNEIFSEEIASATVDTPYHNIVMTSILNVGKFNETNVNNVKWIIDEAIKNNEFRINANVNGSSIDFCKTLNFAIEQNGKYIKPMSADIPKYADRSNDTRYRYSSSCMTIFDITALNVQSPAKFLISYAGEKIVFDIDFNKYK